MLPYWLCKKLVPDNDVVQLLPFLFRGSEQELERLIILLRRKAAKRKLISILTFGKLPESAYKTKARHWFFRKLIEKLR